MPFKFAHDLLGEKTKLVMIGQVKKKRKEMQILSELLYTAEQSSIDSLLILWSLHEIGPKPRIKTEKSVFCVQSLHEF